MSTKLTGDISEQAAILAGLRRGWGVLRPVGDRLPYDLVYDVAGKLVRVQVKTAWFSAKSGNWVVNTKRSQTNRKVYKSSAYKSSDFDFALVYMPKHDVFYVFPVEEFIAGGSHQLVEVEKRQRKPRSAQYREAWQLI